MDSEQIISQDIDAAINTFSGQYGTTQDALIPILQGIQGQFRYIPVEAIRKVSETLSIYESEIYGVITFYTQFRLKPVGEHIIKVCKGTACHVGGAETVSSALQDVLEIGVGETTRDKKFTLEEVACLGCCSLAPVMMIGDAVHGYLTKEKIGKIIRGIREE